MAKGEVSLAVEDSEEKAASVVQHNSDQKGIIQYWKSATENGGHRTNGLWATVKKRVHEQNLDQQILDPPGRFLPNWNTIFVISCVFAVSLDPLFFYIPIINEDIKCIRLDKRLKAIALGLRALTDLFYLVDILVQILRRPKAETSSASGITKTKDKGVLLEGNKLVNMDFLAIAKRILQSYTLLDIVALLPVPQMVVFIFFSKMRGSRSLKTKKFLNSLVLLQYIPRVVRIYLLCNERKTTRKAGIWVKGFFNFFLYILASHVLGALWYFFAIHREIDCWHYACQRENGCEPSTFNCDDHSLRNITFLNGLCPVSPPNATLFDFGIFVDAIQSGMLGSTDFPQKFLNCFWWGLQNLSSLGQNLQTSSYAWENLFAVFISVIGLLLFVYLIGNLQTYMQLETASSEKLRRKMKMKGLEVELWLYENDLPQKMKALIMENVQRKLEDNKNAHVEILSVLPLEYLSFVKRCLCLPTLRKVPKLKQIEGLDELKEICEHFKPMIYTKDTFIIREGEPLDMVLFITHGTVRTYTSSYGGKHDQSSNPKSLKKGDYYGEELINWASQFPQSSELPISSRIVRCLTKVEAFTLAAEDLKNHVVFEYFWHFTKDMKLNLVNDSQRQQLEILIISALRRALRRRAIRRQNSQVKKHTKYPQLGEGRGLVATLSALQGK